MRICDTFPQSQPVLHTPAPALAIPEVEIRLDLCPVTSMVTATFPPLRHFIICRGILPFPVSNQDSARPRPQGQLLPTLLASPVLPLRPIQLPCSLSPRLITMLWTVRLVPESGGTKLTPLPSHHCYAGNFSNFNCK